VDWSDLVGPPRTALREVFPASLGAWVAEPLVLALGGFHAAVLGVAVATRGHDGVQLGLFGTVALLLRLSERINSAARANWELVASANYFDPGGKFFACVWGLPLLTVMAVQVSLFLVRVSRVAVAAKVAQLKAARRAEQRERGSAGECGARGREESAAQQHPPAGR